MCGCKQPTLLAKYTDSRYCTVKGYPRRYLRGHSARGRAKPAKTTKHRPRTNPIEHRTDGTTIIFLDRKDGTRLECVLDTPDYDLVKSFRWTAKKHFLTYYAVSKQPGSGPRVAMHSLLSPAPVGLEVDHEDRNGLNNCRHNLRHATRSQQAARTRKTKRDNAHSKYRGVSRSARIRQNFRWSACISQNYKKFSLGTYDREEDAARAYNTAAIKLFGVYATLNEVTPLTLESEELERRIPARLGRPGSSVSGN